MLDPRARRLKIAIVGTGISGMAAAWLLNTRHDVTVFESANRIGGHSNTVDVEQGGARVPVDTGFIVYNEAAYPNLTALFEHLRVPTQPSDMSFAVSLDGGGIEYSGSGLAGLLAQKRNILRPRFWSMLSDIRRFYREAPRDAVALDQLHLSLGDYLDARGYGAAFRDDHLLPMAAAIWSAPPAAMLDYPVASFLRFQDNHGLLRITGRPQWRTVTGGSRAYVSRLTQPYADRIRTGAAIMRVRRDDAGVEVIDAAGQAERFDHIVIASHADQALAMLEDAGEAERRLLGAFRYSRNIAILHTDAAMMPKRRSVWSSWNYLGTRGEGRETNQDCTVTYWMNQLQSLDTAQPVFVTLNPRTMPDPDRILREELYEHPMFNAAALRAQRALWTLQGERNTWFCGAYFGAGFHEDGLQSGLAVAEALGGERRPWNVAEESGRIFVTPGAPALERTI